MNRKRILLSTMAVALAAITATAAPRTKAQMAQAAAQAINELRAQKRLAPRKAADLKTLKSAAGYEIIGFGNKGFAVIATDDNAPAVLGVSTETFSGENTNFNWWLETMNEVVQYAATNGVQLAPVKPDPTKFPTSLAPLMTTHWDQLEPYNRLCPISNGGDKCYTGCVATAMAQVLNYHKSPEHGYGQATIYYPHDNHSGQPVSADFEHTYYDWDNMLDSYTPGSYNDVEALAVATLMKDCAVAADMEYGGSQEGGSGAYSQVAAEGLVTHFGFADARCVERDNYYGTKYYTDEEWMDMVYTELNENGPLYYGGADSYMGGHAFVVHGYNADGKVYVNWGWSGDSDGYYDISLLNPGYYSFKSGQDMIVGIKGTPRDLTSEELTLNAAGDLSQMLSEESIGTVGTLKLTGDINSSDVLMLRKLAGVDEYGAKTGGYMHTLDLSGARIVEGGKAYLVDGSTRLTTTNDELPDRAFYGARQLKKVILPAGLKHFGDGALALCPLLGEVEIGEPAEDADFKIVDEVVWNTDQTEVIEVLPSKAGELTFDKGTTAIHDYAMAGCGRLQEVTLPSSIETIGREAFRSATGLSMLKVSHREAPTLTGADVFTGVNVYFCKLYVPSGTKTRYAQKAQWKEFKGSDYDNIVEFGSTVKVRNALRYYGDENPNFGYQVIGDAISGEPVLTCEATPNSPAGRYPITISAGTITDETVVLEDGYLVIQKVKATATVNDATREPGQPNPEFTLSYEGLVAGDEVPVWLEGNEPVITTTADENSPVGEYPIIVESGNAESYKFTFVAGVLTVTEPTAITTIKSDSKHSDAIYTIDGRQVTTKKSDAQQYNLKKGIYIKNGRKVVVK